MSSKNCLVTFRWVVAAALLGWISAATSAEERLDNLPMYGQPAVPRPEVLRQADKDFITNAVAGFGGSREAASKAWDAQGNRYLQEGNLDYAMRRYNQAWLLDPSSYRPYWGFARVMLQTDRLDDAISHFETAKVLCKDNDQKAALLSDAGTAYSHAGMFDRANEQFVESTALDPAYGAAWYRWSQSFYRQGNYAEAWSKLKRARSLGARVSDAYVRALSEKLPETP